MDRARDRLSRRWRGHGLLWCSEASGSRNMSRPALGSLRLLRLWLHRLRVPVLRLGAVELAGGWLGRGRSRLRLLGYLLRHRSLRLRLLILLRRLLACRSAILSLAQSRKLTRKNRLFITWRYLLRVKRNVELDARLAASILLILAGIESGQQFLNQSVGKLQVAFVIRLVGSIFAIVDPQRSAIGAIL